MAIVISGVNNNDKITASDGTIDLLSGVNYAGIITAPAITTSGNITAGSINIGPGISLGQSGVATATTFVGNLTGNVNATSNLLLQIGGSEKFRVGSSGQLGIGGANYGTSGQVLTSGGSGSAATWSTVTGTTINNNANDRVITGSASANTLEAEANLTFETATTGGTLTVAGTSEYQLRLKDSNTSGNGAETALAFTDSGNTIQGFVGYNYWGDGNLDIQNNNSGGNVCINTGGENERLRIGSSGGVGISTDKIRNSDFLHIATASQDFTNPTEELMDGGGICFQNTDTLATTGKTLPGIFWATNTNELGRARAGIIGVSANNHDAADIVFLAKYLPGGEGIYPRNERMRITNAGKVGINSTTPQQTLDVRGSINGGSENQPFQRFHDSHGNQRTTKHYFRCTKGGTSIFDIIQVDLNTNFHQALVIIYYGTRIQAVADSVTYPVNKVIGVNRFNGGSVQFEKITVMQNNNAANHADIDVVATSSTQYRVRLTFSGTAGGSSFAAGYVEIIGLGPGTDGAFYSLAHGYGITR